MSLEQAIFSDTKLSNAFKAIGSTKLSEFTKYNKNMVLSTIPIDQSKIVIQQSSIVGSRLTAITNSQQQQQLGIPQFHRRSPSKIITSTSSQQNQGSNMSVTSQNLASSQILHSHIQHENHNVTQPTSNHQNPITKIVGSTSSQQSPSKYVFFQNNGNVQYTSHEAYITTNSTQSNGVGNIVIVATEPMDLNTVNNITGPVIHTANGPVIHTRSNINPNSDEDLTSLTWLQDKNLIKGIVSRSNNSNKNIQTLQPTNYKLTNRVLSPSIEFIEETTIHGDATNEEHSESLKSQQLSCNSIKNEYILEKAASLQSPNKLVQSHHSSNFSSPIRQVQISQPNNNFSTQLSNNSNNNSRLNKNHILSTVNSTYPSTSPNLVQENVNNNLSAIGATTTVHVGPSGTTTVVEYKTKPNSASTNSRQYTNEYTSTILNSNQNIIMPTKNHTISTNMFSQNNVILSTSIQPNANQSSLDCTPNQTNQNTYTTFSSNNHLEPTLSSITTHHPHKKYLREQMNGLEQNNNTLNSNINNGADELINNTERDCRRNNDDENHNTARQFPSLSPPAPLNYSSNRKISSMINKAHNINNLHSEYVAYSDSDFSNTLKSNQVIFKEYEIDSVKEVNKTGGSVIPLSTVSKPTTKEQIINSSSPVSASSSKQKHPNNIPYDPKAHANAKPPYSFSSLIFMAIEDSTEKALPVKEIYAWIVQHFPYFKTAPTGWKNSVRHNLSLNKSFLKVEKAPNMGKGSLWRVEQHQRPNLIQALTRSPFYPCPAVDKLSPHKNSNTVKVTSSTETYSLNDLESPPTTPVKSNLDAKLFPKLSKLMKEMGNVRNEKNSPFPENNAEIDSLEQCEYQSDLSSYSHNVSSNNSSIDEFSPQNGSSTPNFSNNVQKLARDCGADSIDDVNAATAMLALKHGSKIFSDNFNNGTPVITNSPSADHTYSAGNGNNSSNLNDCTSAKTTNYEIENKNGSDNISTSASSDAAYESSDESHNLTPDQLEHQRRFEGVDALLSLSSICSQSSVSTNPNFSNLKRPATEYIEDHKTCMENIPYLNGKGVSGSSLDEGYNTQGNYSQMSSLSTTKSIATVNIVHTPTSSPLPKKLKSSRLRTKIKQIKRKTASLR